MSLFRRKRTVESLRLEPGDVLIVQSRDGMPLLTQEAIHRIVEDLGQVFPHNTVAFLDEGLDLERC